MQTFSLTRTERRIRKAFISCSEKVNCQKNQSKGTIQKAITPDMQRQQAKCSACQLYVSIHHQVLTPNAREPDLQASCSVWRVQSPASPLNGPIVTLIINCCQAFSNGFLILDLGIPYMTNVWGFSSRRGMTLRTRWHS